MYIIHCTSVVSGDPNRQAYFYLKGTVQWELRWVKIGINQSIMTNKDNSVGLIWLQGQSSDAVAAQRRCISKWVVKTSAGIITALVLQRCNCAALMCPKMLPRGEKLVWRIFFLHLISHIFFLLDLCSHWLTNKNTASGWLVTKISQQQLLWFFNANRRFNTENQHKYMATKKYY